MQWQDHQEWCDQDCEAGRRARPTCFVCLFCCLLSHERARAGVAASGGCCGVGGTELPGYVFRRGVWYSRAVGVAVQGAPAPVGAPTGVSVCVGVSVPRSCLRACGQVGVLERVPLALATVQGEPQRVQRERLPGVRRRERGLPWWIQDISEVFLEGV